MAPQREGPGSLRIDLQSGFSLVETMVCAGLAGLVALASSYLVLQHIQTRKMIETKLETLNQYGIASSLGSNLSKISSALILNESGGRNASLDRCLAGHPEVGQSCASHAINSRRIPGASTLETTVYGSKVSSEVWAALECDDLACGKVHVHVVTTESQGAKVITRRQEDKEYPGSTFASEEQINFECAGPSPLTAINMENRSGICFSLLSLGQSQCSSTAPLQRFGSSIQCQAMENVRCPGVSGVGRTGLFRASSSCAIAALR